MSQARDALEAWRAAERRLEAETDPEQRVAREAEVEALREEYMQAASQTGEEFDIAAHGDE